MKKAPGSLGPILFVGARATVFAEGTAVSGRSVSLSVSGEPLAIPSGLVRTYPGSEKESGPR